MSHSDRQTHRWMGTGTYTCAHTYTRTHTCARTHTRMDTEIQKYSTVRLILRWREIWIEYGLLALLYMSRNFCQVIVDMHSRIFLKSRKKWFIRTRNILWSNSFGRIHTHTHARAKRKKCAHTRAHTHTYTLSLSHTHTHTYIYIYTYIVTDCKLQNHFFNIDLFYIFSLLGIIYLFSIMSC